MEWRWLLVLMLATAAAAKKKHKHHKPGRAVLDGLTSTTVEEVSVNSRAGSELVPAPLDVAPFATVVANATCGDGGAEEYCRDTPGKRVVVCDVCESEDGPAARRHPAAHATDGVPGTWWQSPTLAEGDYQHVEFVATLPGKMELLHVIIKSGPSPRPLAWSLEVSPTLDGDDYRLFRAFGDKELCRRLWDLRPERRRRKVRAVRRTNRADKPTCSTQFASPRPLENGEMHIAIGEGVEARRVRISFRAPHPGPARQRYYTVRALTLAARCLCHGRARDCEVNLESAQCACETGHCGAHCQQPCAGGGGGGCDCGQRGECVVDDTGAQLCVNCTDNRAGPLCDRCLPGFYNELPDGPCLPCNCDSYGSDGNCIFTPTGITCSCLPDYTGVDCSACLNGGSPPHCDPPAPVCQCDPLGVRDPEGVCDDVCVCKDNVIGAYCSACAPGYFGLGAPGGCRRCYCRGLADTCALDDSNDGVLNEIMPLPLNSSWQVTAADHLEILDPAVDDDGNLYVISYEVEGWDSFYWSTTSLRGNQGSLYGGTAAVRLRWGVVRGDTGGRAARGVDAVLEGGDDTKLYYGNRTHNQPGELELAIPLEEGEWFTEKGEVATREEFMAILGDLRRVMIRGHFHGDQDEVRLEAASVHPAPHPRVERCVCPPTHSGRHCEDCAPAHVRVNGLCLPCPCNGHAECSDVLGPCGECRHNTTGARCERCLPGHYGNPVLGGCRPCACPLFAAANNFSPNCALAAANGDDYVCTQCPPGYAGDHCESCDTGYWGSPATAGGACVPCACGGAACDAATGACITCPAHTEGAKCEACQEGYWFGPTPSPSPACVPCACGAGALAAACDVTTGQCACKRGWAGRDCGGCGEGYGNPSSGCPPCHCGAGAHNATCAPDTGVCVCAPGAAPPHCDTCLPEHYGLHEGGCLGCNCSSLGAESNACDIRTGQCRCRAHVIGRACDTCEEGYYGLRADGCRPCACGAGAACDPVTGRCACGVGVGGDRCDRCLPGYYGLSATGCLPCAPCPEGKICSPTTGRCVCPPHARGANCGACARGYWRPPGLHRAPCQRCQCGEGAVSDTCDQSTGACACRAGWGGVSCGVCAAGHHGARCRPCRCGAGTRLCGNETCTCDRDGKCPCKENVIGHKCDQCLEGTFGLSADNPTGCTACFCFGRASSCTEAKLSRAALHAHVPTHLTLLYNADAPTNIDENSLLSIPTHSEARITVPSPPVPVYAALGARFMGDRLTSYGGALRFTVEEEGGVDLPIDTRNRFPLVRLFGADIVLDYYERIPPINGSHAVYLHETLWRGATGRGAGWGVASRGALLLALARLEGIAVRLTTRAPTADDPVHALLLNVSLDTAIPGLSRSSPASGLEACDCTRGWAGASCQRPAVGWTGGGVRTRNVQGTIVIDVEGAPEPCRCNGRADECDARTGECFNCTAGTAGAHCEVCAPGHHGAPDTPAGCAPCPCPSRARNYARGCRFGDDGRLRCLCKTGYTGESCDQCAPGYYRGSLGDCTPCACDPRGSMGTRCDERGRCTCKPHVTGDKCDVCRGTRLYLDGDGCQACDNCTQTLLDSIESLTASLRARINQNELDRIPAPFPTLLEFAHNSTMSMDKLHSLRKEQWTDLEPAIHELEAREHRLLSRVADFKERALSKDNEALYLSLESMTSLEEVLKLKGKLGELVGVLEEFAKGERHVSAHKALKESRRLLSKIKEVKLADFIAGANDVSDTASLQSTAVRELGYRIQQTQDGYSRARARLESWLRRADDVTALAAAVWGASDALAPRGDKVRDRWAAVGERAGECRGVLQDIESLSPHNLTEDAHNSLIRARTLTHSLPSELQEVTALTTAAEEKEGILYNLTPVYKQKYLEPVDRHVDRIKEKARYYKSLLSGPRTLASSSVRAATAWADVARGVARAHALATHAHTTAHAAAHLAGHTPLTHTANHTIGVSEGLRRRAGEALARVEAIGSTLAAAVRTADVVRVVLRGIGWHERGLAARPRAHVQDALRAAHAQLDRVFETTRVLYEEASEKRRAVLYQMKRQLADLSRLGDAALGAAQEHVSQIRSNTIRGSETAAALEAAAAARAHTHGEARRRVAPALGRLSGAVERARHAAGTISVSLSSPPGASVGCARAFRPRALSPAATKLSLAVSFDGEVMDGTLLQLVDEEQEPPRYLKLSVSNQRLRLSWRLGAADGVLAADAKLAPAHPGSDQLAYTIDIERVWNTVTLSVRGPTESYSLHNTSAAAGTSLGAPILWVGGPGGTGGLRACLHGLWADGRNVGLWNFEKQPKGSLCVGCMQRSVPSHTLGGSGACLDGSGYAALKRSSRRAPDPRQFSLALTFKTTDTDALLFMANDDKNNRSVSLWLRSCRVVFAVQYGGGGAGGGDSGGGGEGARLEIVSRGRHCDDKPAHVQAIRVFAGDKLERGSLRVNGEETLGSASPAIQSSAALPDLSAAHYWLGGGPPGAPGDLPSLRGCISQLIVDRQGYDLADTSARSGLRPVNMATPLRSLVLEGSGYIELKAPAIRRRAALGLSFRARAPSGLLLFRAPGGADSGAEDKHYLAILLVEGDLELIASAGKAELRARTNGTKFDDGAMHALRLVRAHKQIELWVDDTQVLAGVLPGNAYPDRPGGLYLGGVHGWGPQGPPQIPTVGFTGTLADFIVDNTLIDLETAVGWQGALLGRADPPGPPRAPPTPLHAAMDKGVCTKPASFTVEAGALRLGDVAGSHAALRVRRAPASRPDLRVQLQLRTYRGTGVVMVVPGTKAKPKHFIALFLRDGRARLVVRGRRRREVTVQNNVADGKWQDISIRVGPSRISLSAGGGVSGGAGGGVRARRVYVGGLPLGGVPHLPNAIQRIGGVVGCIRHVSVNGEEVDVARRAQRVGQCFPDVLPAAYFAGDAYATWSSSWAGVGAGGGEGVGGEVVLWFRTTHPRGVLLSVGDTVVELRDGAVVVSTLGLGPEWGAVFGRGACSGSWRRLRLGGGGAALDGGAPRRAPRPPRPLAEPEPQGGPVKVYIGGLPEGSPEFESGRENFKGCIRDVSVGGDARDWLHMEALHHVMLDSCPVID